MVCNLVSTYTCRLQLAALHFNENTNRKQAVTKQGTKQYNVAFPKYKKGDYMIKKVLVNATYGKAYRGLPCTLLKMNFSIYIGYIEKLMSKTITICKEDTQCTLTEDIPKPLSTAYQHPLKEIAIQEHRSRFSTTK